MGKLFATQALSQTQKHVSEPQTGIEPAISPEITADLTVDLTGDEKVAGSIPV